MYTLYGAILNVRCDAAEQNLQVIFSSIWPAIKSKETEKHHSSVTQNNQWDYAINSTIPRA